MAYMKDSTGRRLDEFPVQEAKDYTALLACQAALGACGVNRFNVVHIGDSTTEGERGTLWTGRWVDVLQTYLRRVYQPPGITGGAGYIPAYYATNYLPDQFTLAGSPPTIGGYGLGLRCLNMTTSAHKATGSFTGTGIEVHYSKTTGSGVMGVSIDGGAVTNVTTASGGGISDDGVWYSPALTAGAHTVEISWVSGGSVYFEGIHVLNGDETSGIHTYEAGHAAYLSSNFVPGTSYWDKRLTVLQPQLVTIQLGANDCFGSVPAATFKTNLQTLITRIRSRITIPPTIMLNSLYTPIGSEATWPAYRQAMVEIANADAGVVLFDMEHIFGDMATDPYDLLYDYVHANPRGQGVQALNMNKLLAA